MSPLLRLLLLLLALPRAGAAEAVLPLRTNDVVATVGGAQAVAAAEAGHLESLVQARRPALRLRFRCLAWEGDTVTATLRDVNFPSTTELLARHGVTLLLVDLGQNEALDPTFTPAAFRAAYAARLEEYARVTPRMVLLTPPPVEPGRVPGGPELGAAAGRLAVFAGVIRDLAAERGLPVADVFAALNGPDAVQPLTVDGRQLTPRAQAQAAFTVANTLAPSSRDIAAPDKAGRFPDPDLENLRQAVSAKNRLWHAYWRPTNWAFLWGDRMEQPSSRDHRDRNLRWFPAEMEEYVPLIREAEGRIESLAAQIR